MISASSRACVLIDETRTWRNRLRNALIQRQPNRSRRSSQPGWSFRHRHPSVRRAAIVTRKPHSLTSGLWHNTRHGRRNFRHDTYRSSEEPNARSARGKWRSAPQWPRCNSWQRGYTSPATTWRSFTGACGKTTEALGIGLELCPTLVSLLDDQPLAIIGEPDAVVAVKLNPSTLQGIHDGFNGLPGSSTAFSTDEVRRPCRCRAPARCAGPAPWFPWRPLVASTKTKASADVFPLVLTRLGVGHAVVTMPCATPAQAARSRIGSLWDRGVLPAV